MNKKFTINVIAVILGFIIGNTAITFAQQIYLPDSQWKACWTQNNATLEEASGWKVRVSYNNGAPTDTTHTCKIGNPIDCSLTTPVPLSLQVGTLNIKIEGAVVQIDGSLGPYVTLIDSLVTFGALKLNPPSNSGSNLRLIKQLLESLQSLNLQYYW